jgi:hypothetical protein
MLIYVDRELFPFGELRRFAGQQAGNFPNEENVRKKPVSQLTRVSRLVPTKMYMGDV